MSRVLNYRQSDENLIVRGYGKHTGRFGVIEEVFTPAPLGLYQRIEVRWEDGSIEKAFRDEIQPVTIEVSKIHDRDERPNDE